MTDIFIDNNKLKIENGDFVLVNEIDQIKQHVTVALNTFYGEWILDREKGIDYTFGLRNMHFLENKVRKQIMDVDKVKSINNFEFKFSRDDLTINVSADILTDYGSFYLDRKLAYQV